MPRNCRPFAYANWRVARLKHFQGPPEVALLNGSTEADLHVYQVSILMIVINDGSGSMYRERDSGIWAQC